MWGPEIKLYVPKVLFEFTVHIHQTQFEDGVTHKQMLAVAKHGSSWVAAQRWDKTSLSCDGPYKRNKSRLGENEKQRMAAFWMPGVISSGKERHRTPVLGDVEVVCS